MPSFLIINRHPDQAREAIEQICQQLGVNFDSHHPDTLVIQPEKSIGIDQIRQIKNFLAKKSWQGRGPKIVVVPQAQLMTLEAQNAFLKTLEEPPAQAIIILLSNNRQALLETIISRCHLVKTKEVPVSQSNSQALIQEWQKIVNMPLADRLQLSQIKAKDRAHLQQWLDQLILALQEQLIQADSTTDWARWLKLISRARQMLIDNLSPQCALDWLMLKL